MKKIVFSLAAITALMLGGLATASAATGPELEIVKVGYNANGADNSSNRWKEYIDLKNTSGHAVNVKGWSTQDAWADNANGNTPDAGDCNTAVFSAGSGAAYFQHLGADNPDTPAVETEGLWLPAGQFIRVYSGGSVDTQNNSWHSIALNKSACGYQGHYLGNGGDSIFLKNADGDLVTKFTYDFDNGYYIR